MVLSSSESEVYESPRPLKRLMRSTASSTAKAMGVPDARDPRLKLRHRIKLQLRLPREALLQPHKDLMLLELHVIPAMRAIRATQAA